LTKNWPLLLILVIYLVVGGLYAMVTPAWQVPDEPAHYNYVRTLALGREFPVMQAGDYDQRYLEQLTSQKFPPELPVHRLEYEDHQPPLYYLLATPVYWLVDGYLPLLRMFSVLVGGVGVVLLGLILREFLPERPGFAWLGVGVVAFIPQFVAMMAGVNNDALALTLLWLWLWLALRYLRDETSPWVLGGVLGAVLLTKSTVYSALPLAALAVFLRWRREGQPLRWAARQLLFIGLPALALGGLWWARNVSVYGWPDVMGLIRHAEVVVGQPRTADFIARSGALAFFSGAVRTTFQSFWGQFGWMGVVLDGRIYLGLLIFSGLIVWGAGWRFGEALKSGMEPRQRDGLILLGTAAGITLVLFVGYNLTFVQHQGRYLFPALPLLALMAAFGLERLAERKLAAITALALLAVAVVVGVAGLLGGDLPLWTLALLGAALVTAPTVAAVPSRWRWLVTLGLLIALAALNVWCLFGFIVPQLG